MYQYIKLTSLLSLLAISISFYSKQVSSSRTSFTIFNTRRFSSPQITAFLDITNMFVLNHTTETIIRIFAQAIEFLRFAGINTMALSAWSCCQCWRGRNPIYKMRCENPDCLHERCRYVDL